MGYRPKKRRRPAAEGKPAADMPLSLVVYDAADWLPPDAPPEPADGYDWAAWDAFDDAAHQAAYAAFQRARADWYTKHTPPSIELAIRTPDEPFETPPRKVDERDLAALEPQPAGRGSPLARLGRAPSVLPPVVRNTTRRDKFRAKIRRSEPPCHLCGEPIDYGADHLDPRSFTIDHVVPLAAGGEDSLDNLGGLP
ncbi:MAG: HNH endonuclease [Mycobacterium sp.]